MSNYYKYKLENLIIVSKIVTIHYLDFKDGYENKGEEHNFWELVYVDEGKLFCSSNEQTTILNKGQIIFHRPNEFHSHKVSKEDKTKIIILSFECKSEAINYFSKKILETPENLIKLLKMIVDEGKQTFNIPISDPKLKKMPLKSSPALGGLQIIKNLLETFLISLMRADTSSSYDTTFLSSEEYKNRISVSIISILKKNVHNKLSIDDICSILNYNKSYLFRQFKLSTKKTIMTYFNELKISEAKKLLTTSDLSITEISDTLSYDTPNYFCKAFKKQTGYTPASYRKAFK